MIFSLKLMPGLQITDLSPVFHRLQVEDLPAETNLVERRRREDTLKSEIVNGEDRRDSADDRIGGQVHLLIGGDETGLPVVRVEHRGALARQSWVLERRAAEDRKAPGVVGVVTRGRAIQPLAVEELRRVDEDGLEPDHRHGVVKS